MLEKEKICFIADVACPFDTRIEKEKDKYVEELGDQGFHFSGCNWCFRDGFKKHSQMPKDNWVWWIRKTLESMSVGKR